jgi:hypothetical protein
LKVLKRKSSADNVEYNMLVVDSVSTGIVDVSGNGYGAYELPTALGNYSVGIPIDPYHEYSLQFIKTGAGAVEVKAFFAYTR